MKEYICKIASIDEMEVKWNYDEQSRTSRSYFV